MRRPRVTFIDAGVNTTVARCPRCGTDIDLDWVLDVVDRRQHDLADLRIETPCCAEPARLDGLEYDWPLGFACFEISVRLSTHHRVRPSPTLSVSELDAVAALLGHRVRQVLAHY